MPRIMLDIPDAEYTFVRPALLSIIKDLIERTYFPKTDKVYILAEGHAIPIPGSTLGSDSSTRTVNTDNAVRIEITEDYNNTDYTSGSYPDFNTPAIFVDNAMGVKIRTLYMPVWYDISATLRFNSISKAKSWVQRHSIATRLGRTALEHKFTGSYPIHKTVLLLLSELHHKGSVNANDLGTVRAWLESHMTPRYVIVAAQDGVKKGSMISDSHANATGGFSFDTTPDPISKIDANSYQVELTYRVRLEKPAHIYATYPLMAYNTPLDEAFVTRDHRASHLDDEANPRSNRAVVLAEHFTQHIEYFTGALGFPIPYYDDWNPGVRSPATAPILRMQMLVSPADLRDVLNLRNLGGVGNNVDIIEVNASLLDFIANDPTSAISIYGSPINVCLYKGNDPLITEMITLDSDLNLRTVEDMDIRGNYHLMISLMYDMRPMWESSKEALRRNPTLFIAYCDALYPFLRSDMMAVPEDAIHWKILTDGSISRPGFDEIVYRGAMLYRSKKQKDILFGKSVMSFTINARGQ